MIKKKKKTSEVFFSFGNQFWIIGISLPKSYIKECLLIFRGSGKFVNFFKIRYKAYMLRADKVYHIFIMEWDVEQF